MAVETPRTISAEPLPTLGINSALDSTIIRRPQGDQLVRPQVNLVEAINLVAKAVTARIAFHEREIAALRAALRPFNEAAMVRPVPTDGLQADDAINQLLTIAGRLNHAAPDG